MRGSGAARSRPRRGRPARAPARGSPAATGRSRARPPLANGTKPTVGVTDRYWGPIEPSEAAAVLGRPVEIVAQHLRWLFAVARCRWDGGEMIVKRQPPMGRDPGQLHWQHRLTNHLADRGVPAARSRGLVIH